MEIAHGSHEHPLFFTDGESEDNQDELVICGGCNGPICGPRFSCFSCRFHLHKSCAELPPRLLGHPLHPHHPLSLLFAYHRYHKRMPSCNACNRYDYIFLYHCFQCNFHLDIICALSVDQEGNVVSESTGEHDYFRYGLQQHLLVLEEEQSSSLETNGVNCFVCSESMSAPFFFCSRLKCQFQIHKFCANLPKQIKNSLLHPERSLYLVGLGTYNDAHCQMCGQQGRSFYVCLEPDLLIHPKCTFSNPRDTMTRVGEKQIQHRSHHHNLTLLEDEKDWAWTGNDDHPSCSLCMEQLASSPSYSCEQCNTFIIHKSCAELAGQIKSHLHPKHSLILFATTTERRSMLCDCCGTNVNKLNYCCLQCGFTFHVDCFLSLHDSERRYDHKHNFVDIKTFRKLACDACGKKNYFSPRRCTACHVMVHNECSELPRFLRVERHRHVLKLTYYLSVVHECNKLICQLCYKEANVDYAVYFCRLCKYGIHLSCGQEIGDAVSEEETQDESLLEGSHNSIGGRIKHFAHEHELTLNEQDPEEHKFCEGCVRIISSPFYSCKECGFYLHKQCGEMPESSRFPFHPHLLQLNPVEKLQYCSICRKIYNGFMYNCEKQDCLLKIDLPCVKLMEGQGVDHPCHEHRLYFPHPKLRHYERCKGCGLLSEYVLVCSECEYVLGYCCAKLPHKVKHRYDEHLLSLAFEKENESGEYYCDICEEERNPEGGFYCCTQCDFFAHMNCALGDHPFVKFGTTQTFSFHDHPLTYVEEPTRKPPPLCHGCGQHCYSRVLECRRCSFNVHFDESCLEEDFGGRFGRRFGRRR